MLGLWIAILMYYTIYVFYVFYIKADKWTSKIILTCNEVPASPSASPSSSSSSSVPWQLCMQTNPPCLTLITDRRQTYTSISVKGEKVADRSSDWIIYLYTQVLQPLIYLWTYFFLSFFIYLCLYVLVCHSTFSCKQILNIIIF